MNSEELVNKVLLNIKNEDIKSKSKSNLKCAPGREMIAGSCISLVVLEEMVRAYNTSTKNKSDNIRTSKTVSTLNPQKYKLYLVHQLGKRIGKKCTTQKCWSNQDFMKHVNKAARIELQKYTFRPDSPQGKFDWLSTFDINDSMEQYEKKYKDFKFFGAVPMDFAELSRTEINNVNYDQLYKSGKTKLGIIFNLDEHNKPGSHWVAMYTDLEKGNIFFFDSFAVRPEKRVRALMRTQARYLQEGRGIKLEDMRTDYNVTQHQKKNTECGVYSMNFLIRMARGDDFDTLCKNVISDAEINKCRKVYFDNYSKKKQ
jgi:hypothetical protein